MLLALKTKGAKSTHSWNTRLLKAVLEPLKNVWVLKKKQVLVRWWRNRPALTMVSGAGEKQEITKCNGP